MLSFASTFLATSFITMATFANQEKEQVDSFGDRLLHCAKVCSECQLKCEVCFTHYLALTGEHVKSMRRPPSCVWIVRSVAKRVQPCVRGESVLARYMLECVSKVASCVRKRARRMRTTSIWVLVQKHVEIANGIRRNAETDGQLSRIDQRNVCGNQPVVATSKIVTFDLVV